MNRNTNIKLAAISTILSIIGLVFLAIYLLTDVGGWAMVVMAGCVIAAGMINMISAKFGKKK